MHCLERNVASSNHIGSRQFLGMSALLSEGFSVSFFFNGRGAHHVTRESCLLIHCSVHLSHLSLKDESRCGRENAHELKTRTFTNPSGLNLVCYHKASQAKLLPCMQLLEFRF